MSNVYESLALGLGLRTYIRVAKPAAAKPSTWTELDTEIMRMRQSRVTALASDVAVYLVGGVVRDLLRGASSPDIDLAVEGDAIAVAGALASELSGTVTAHDRFGTATVRAALASSDRPRRVHRRGAHPRSTRAVT